MPRLQTIACPGCARPMTESEDTEIQPAGSFKDCVRRCEACGIGASNADGSYVTFIYSDPLVNIPKDCRDGAKEVLAQALNVQSRGSKLRRFGFSTSEDAVTWVVFTYLLRSKRLLATLRQADLANAGAPARAPLTLLLWGVPIGDGSRGVEIRGQLEQVCDALGEDPASLSEPDVIVDLGDDGLLFIEVKYRSGNDHGPRDTSHWTRYATARGLVWQLDGIKASGCYELTRNWCLLKMLANGRPATLANLGPAKLFTGPEGARLDGFIAALGADRSSRFRKITWPEFLSSATDDAPVWFTEFLRDRKLIEPRPA
jgi:hypothetical protein